MNIGGVLSIAFIMLAHFVGQKNLLLERSEMLLLHVLPKEISEILKGASRTVADQYDEASILFADVVQFTLLSNWMVPMELVGLRERSCASTSSSRSTGSRRSRPSATVTWLPRAFRDHVPITRRPCPAWRWRSGPVSPSASFGAGAWPSAPE
jgi:hypothetical protein